MNLTKAYDLAKSLEIPQLQPYANGFNPEILPPYVALGEIQAKEARGKRLNAMQGAATGEQPSIKEQYDQKAGLMALQGQQQQQAQQQMMSQMAQAPQPAPEGVPQPEQQPQPQMMAGGGLARLPVDSRMFDYRAGGIIGFAEGKEVPRYPGMIAQEGEGLLPSKTGYEGMDILEFIKEFGIDAYNKIKNAIPGESTEERLARQKREVYEASPQGRQERGVAEANKPEAVDSMELPPRPAMALSTPRVPGGPPSVLPKPAASPPPAAAAAPRPRVGPLAQPPVAAPPTGIQTALPQAAPVQSELEKMQMGALRKEPAARTLADIQAERKAVTPELLNEPAGLAQLARLKQQQEQYTKSQEDRPYERLMAVLGAGGRGGLGSMGAGYLGAVQGERASDAAQAAYQDKIMTAIEAARRGEATTEQTALLSAMGGERSAQAEAAGKRLTAIGTARNTEAQTEVARLDRDSREKIAKLERDMRQAHYLNPISVPTDKDKWIKAFMKSGLSETAAIEKVLGLTGESKERMAGARIDAANAKILADDMSYVNAVKIMDDPNKSPAEKARAKQYKDAKEKALGIAPETTAPTMTPAQAAALAKYGAK